MARIARVTPNSMTKPLAYMLGLTLLAMTAPSMANDHGMHAGHDNGKPADLEKIWKAMLEKPQLATSAVFDASGRLWLAFIEDGYLCVRHSDDQGKTFSPDVRVNRQPEHIAGDGENRPKVAVARDGTIYVSYTQSVDTPMAGHIRFSRSLDGGRHFSAPVTVNDNHEDISHRFEALGISGEHDVYLAWLDKRDLSAANMRHEPYVGAAVYYAVSHDRGKTFARNRKVVDHSCECCRVAMAIDTDGTPVIVWRHVYDGNVRDHALARLDGKSRPMRVSNDRWVVNACPHHGPAIAIAGDGIYHITWFSNVQSRPGLFYARSQDRGLHFSRPLRYGAPDRQASHPAILTQGKNVLVAWKEFDGQSTSIQLMRSSDEGATWSSARTIATTNDASDYPLLIDDHDRPYLSWRTAKEGYRLIPVTEGPGS